jgi:hypothetical protein
MLPYKYRCVDVFRAPLASQLAIGSTAAIQICLLCELSDHVHYRVGAVNLTDSKYISPTLLREHCNTMHAH